MKSQNSSKDKIIDELEVDNYQLRQAIRDISVTRDLGKRNIQCNKGKIPIIWMLEHVEDKEKKKSDKDIVEQVLNEKLIVEGKEPVAFDHDCREGICGMCSMVINGRPHGPWNGTTTCQLHMRMFKDGDTITIEPFRAAAFPVIKDLVVDPI